MERTMFLAIIFATVLLGCSGLEITGWTWTRQMDNKFQLRTDIDLKSERITFSANLTDMPLETDQWIGIGLAPGTGDKNADVVIYTAYNETTSTFADYFTSDIGELVEDEIKSDEDNIDWSLLDIPLDDFTFSVERSFKVKNSTQDREIKNENTYLIWAYGNETSEEGFPVLNGNFTTIGHFHVNLLQLPSSASVNANVNLGYVISLTAIVLFASIKNSFIN